MATVSHCVRDEAASMLMPTATTITPAALQAIPQKSTAATVSFRNTNPIKAVKTGIDPWMIPKAIPGTTKTKDKNAKIVPKLSVTADRDKITVCGVSSVVIFGLNQSIATRIQNNCTTFMRNISWSPGTPAWLLKAMNCAAKALSNAQRRENGILRSVPILAPCIDILSLPLQTSQDGVTKKRFVCSFPFVVVTARTVVYWPAGVPMSIRQQPELLTNYMPKQETHSHTDR
uniref:Uncharacterized protein n=1 Tax=Branchiostoma floridae TaxID=7739 RepID=C3ZBS0_BRAFL|eukprot:XP_002594296.1 hypothetical protein BRAFLDRAFT_65152 [Branchiostoma floridae]